MGESPAAYYVPGCDSGIPECGTGTRMKRMKQTSFILQTTDFTKNFKRLVSALSASYRDELKTHSRHVLGAHFGPKTL